MTKRELLVELELKDLQILELKLALKKLLQAQSGGGHEAHKAEELAVSILLKYGYEENELRGIVVVGTG